MRRSLTCVPLIATLCSALSACAPQQTEVMAAPPAALNYEAFRAATQEFMRFDPGGRIGGVRWDEENQVLRYGHLGEQFAFDLDERRFIDAVEPDEGEQDERPRRDRRRGGPGRGRQFVREAAPVDGLTAVCRDYNVVIEDADGNEVAQVTTDGHRKFRYGMANWVYGEELFERHAMWWSPDARWLVFYEFDEREVTDYYLLSGLTERRTDVLREGYSKPGEANPVAKLLVYDLQTKQTMRIDTHPEGGDEWYLYNVRFTPDGSEILFNRTNRLQNVLHVVAADPVTGASRIVVTETQETWQDNHPYMQFLDDGERFLWATEKTGWNQFELRHLDGRLLATLTQGDYPAISIARIDEAADVVYFMAYGGAHPLNAHLFRVNLDGTDQRRLTNDEGSHSVQFSPDGRWFITRYETVEQPPTTALYDIEGDRIATLAEPDAQRLAEFGGPSPELFSFLAEDGETVLYGSLYKPRDFDPDKSYPLLIDVYGGPDSRAVSQRYRAGNSACALGFLVARIDNRGTSGRGKAFMGAVYEKLGIVDIRDQADGARHLARRPYVDGDRIGIHGHSYGGYMAALAILKFPDVFHAAVAGAPVTDWRNYDTIYTERYMGLPADNAEGYDGGSCMTYAEQLEGRLLIQHGMVDDNVHPNNAWQLVKALQDAGKPFQTMFYPNSGHGLARYSSEARWRFLHENLIANP